MILFLEKLNFFKNKTHNLLKNKKIKYFKGCVKVTKIKHRLITLIFFVIFILIETVSLATYQTAVIEQNQKNTNIKKMINKKAVLSQEEQETLNLINEYRIKNGLEELKPIADLQEVARKKANDIVENKYFSHNSENLGTPFEMLKANNIQYCTAGENLAGNICPEKAFEAWVNSPLHKANILDEDFKYTGLVVIESKTYGKIFVQLFIGI